MKKLFLVGDFYSNTGPANVNKNIKKSLEKKAIYSNCKNHFSRIVEMIFKILISENILFCSFSKIDIYGIKICKLLKKNTFYLMHGYVKYEQQINNNYNQNKIKIENYILNNVDKVFCVSKKFMNYMNKLNYNTTFDFVYNGIEFKENSNLKNKKNEYQIISTGGGVPRKNNLIICEAIKKINETSKKKLKYIVIGNACGKQDQFLKYDFVEYYEYLPHDECLKKMSESSLYIQNSLFETFGLAIAEALNCGCKLLISKNVGIIDVLNNINSNEIINNPNDIEEISKKILIVSDQKYETKITIDKKINNIDNRAKELYSKIINHK